MQHKFLYQVNSGEVISVTGDTGSEEENPSIIIDIEDSDTFMATTPEDIDSIIALLQMAKMLIFGEESLLTLRS